jgi:hypothetical protein
MSQVVEERIREFFALQVLFVFVMGRFLKLSLGFWT